MNRDYREARHYYTAAAQQGHATAQNNLGSLYEHGEGVRKNIRQAADWYRKAANQGEVVAAVQPRLVIFPRERDSRETTSGRNLVSCCRRTRLSSCSGESRLDVLHRHRSKSRLLGGSHMGS